MTGWDSFDITPSICNGFVNVKSPEAVFLVVCDPSMNEL